MIVALFEIQNPILVVCPFIGLVCIALSCFYFFGMLIYSLIADEKGLPQPLNDDYLIGKINIRIWLGLAILGVIFMII